MLFNKGYVMRIKIILIFLLITNIFFLFSEPYISPIVNNLRLRKTPSLKGEIIELLKKGEKLTIIEIGKEEIINKVYGRWVKIIKENNIYGWCFDAYLKLINQNEPLLIYRTEKVLKIYPHNWSDIENKIIIRNFDGSYQKEIYYIINTPEISRGTNGFIIDKNLGLLSILGASSYEDQKIIDIFGNIIITDIKYFGHSNEKMISPNKKYLATFKYSDRGKNFFTLIDLEKEIKKEYNSSKLSEHVVLSGWSKDNKYLFLQNGIYEFAAPAEIWKINLNNKKVMNFNLSNLWAPVYFFLDYNVAYADDNKPYGDHKYISLYEINLDDKSVKKILTKNTSSITNVIRFKNYLYFQLSNHVSKEDKFIQLNLLNNQEKEIYNERIKIIDYSLEEKWVLLHTYNYVKILYLDNLKEIKIGETYKQGYFRPLIDGKEYIQQVVGVIK
jgi:hypothetical protein